MGGGSYWCVPAVGLGVGDRGEEGPMGVSLQ